MKFTRFSFIFHNKVITTILGEQTQAHEEQMKIILYLYSTIPKHLFWPKIQTWVSDTKQTAAQPLISPPTLAAWRLHNKHFEVRQLHRIWIDMFINVTVIAGIVLNMIPYAESVSLVMYNRKEQCFSSSYNFSVCRTALLKSICKKVLVFSAII